MITIRDIRIWAWIVLLLGMALFALASCKPARDSKPEEEKPTFKVELFNCEGQVIRTFFSPDKYLLVTRFTTMDGITVGVSGTVVVTELNPHTP